jgi:tripartite-type tricarboxylate transporter receptor subunit TctC
MGRSFFCVWAIFSSLVLVGTAASGATFPTKPVTVIVNFSPGAGIDLEARGIVPYVQKHLGTRVTIENVPGADGKIGLTRVWKAKPDGYNVIIHTTTLTLIGERIAETEYRFIDFTHIFSWSRTNSVLVVNSEKWKTFNEFVTAAKERALSAGVPGRGTASHLAGLILVDALGIKVNWVPFDGSGEALTALAGNHIDFASVASTSGLPLVKAGKLRALVAFANNKDPVFPDVPLAKDLGYNFPVVPMIRGVDGPPKMDQAATKAIEAAFAKAIKDPEYLAWAEKRMVEVISLNQEEYTKAIESQITEIDRYKNFFKAATK